MMKLAARQETIDFLGRHAQQYFFPCVRASSSFKRSFTAAGFFRAVALHPARNLRRSGVMCRLGRPLGCGFLIFIENYFIQTA